MTEENEPKEENALAIQEQRRDIQLARAPEIVLSEAQRAARALKDVIEKKDHPVMFNGKQYLTFEDWQTIGKFYGLTVSTIEPRYIVINGLAGAKASAEVVDVKTGTVVGHAEAFCMRDEKNWKDKPWFQLASMAQTRAGAKALRNVLSWVVVLAGYQPTPYEEMDAVRVDPPREEIPENLPEALKEDLKKLPPNAISYPQSKRFFAIARHAGASNDEVKAYLATKGLAHSAEITRDVYEQYCNDFESGAWRQMIGA